MSRPTAPSPNIATLDSQIFADLCDGQFYVDITPSVFIDAGADNGLGVKVQITSPVGVVIKPFGTGYDIPPPFADVFQYSIPTQAGNYQYGTYIIEVEFTDADSTVYALSKSVRICEPDLKNKTKKWGSLSALIKGVCRDGKVFISVDNIPNYRGKEYQDTVYNLTIGYPSASGKDDLVTGHPSLTLQLYEGEYSVLGTACATYNFGDNVFVNVLYKIKRIKPVKCVIDETCVASAMHELQMRINAGCSEKEIREIKGIMDDGFRLFNLAVMMGQNGEDPSDIITQLEQVLGCKCTCNCNEGTPIINNTPANDFTFEGCGFEEETVGLTKVITIKNYDHEVRLALSNGGILAISEPALDEDNCKKTQDVTFNITTVYQQLKNLADTEGEELFWGAIIKKILNDLDFSCMNLTEDQVTTLSFSQLMQLWVNRTCAGGTCDAAIASATIEAVGADVVLTFSATDADSVDIYLDSLLVANILATATTYTFAGAADGETHTYRLVPKCTSGLNGAPYSSDEFTFFGCPQVEPVALSDTSVSGDCPFDLTSLETEYTSGVIAEWHTENNTSVKSLVADPTSVLSGIYYAFAKDGDCYSIGRQVTVVCTAAADCTAPQTLLVTTITGGNRVTFQSAAVQPPASSYTVKRRLKADADVDGSYTTIGTPTWSATLNRWQILDDSASDNTLYTYRAISNCESSAPYIDYDYAQLTCPEMTLTPSATDMDYSFEGAGGEVDQYEVKIYNSAGTVLIHTDTITPAFSSPITGTFIYLDPATTYKVRIRMSIGSYYKDCPFVTATTNAETGTETITWDYTNMAGVSGFFRLVRNGSVVVYATSTSSGSILAAIGDDIDAIVNTTLSGDATVTITGAYTNSVTNPHVAADAFTVVAGAYAVTATSDV